ncbi:MAG: NAD(P)/FAD-dependent oxidoreductase [Dehalococcoidales bacterium]|nr:NAD(P)/FAD-dependent oxidoreductase [Dehalococcoidales bacterium]
MEKSVIIIGAGVAGLTSGIYGQMNGYKTRIFEMDIKPGGLCTAWERKGYVIDGCLHWLVGTSPESEYYRLWQEVGIIKDKHILNMTQFIRFEDAEGKVFTFYTDVDQLEKHMLEIAPQDTDIIHEIARSIRHFSRFSTPVGKPSELYSPIDSIKIMRSMSPFMGEMRKWGKITMKDLASRFKNPLLRQAWQSIWLPDFSCAFMLMTLAWLSNKNAGYIMGGSMGISLAMEKRYIELGGKINYRSGVEKILVENNRAVGVKLTDGTEHRADYIVSAADGHSTIFEMLEGKYIDNTVRGYYKDMPVFPGLVYIGLGVNASFKDIPQIISGLVFPLKKPIKIGNKEEEFLTVRIHNFDPALAPEGKTLLTVSFISEFSYWEKLYQDKESYNAEKERIAVAVVSALNNRFPGLAGDLEMWDVATPVTFKHYTNNWQGSFEGWLMTPQNINLQMKRKLPGLDNFYMVGQWVSPGGGLPGGLITGNHLIQILCKRDKKQFTTSLP